MTFLEKHTNLTKEELLQLDFSELNKLRQEMGDQEFIDHWTLTQEEYSYLINQIPESVIVSETLVKKQAEVATKIGTTEILYPTRRGPATLISNSVIVTAPVKVEEKTVSKVLTTSSYVPVEQSEVVWKSELPAYSIIRQSAGPITTSTLTTSSYVPVAVNTATTTNDAVWRSDVPAYQIIRQTEQPVVSTTVYSQAPTLGYATRYVNQPLYSSGYINQPLYSSGYVNYGYPAYSTFGTRRLSTGYVTDAPVVINDAPIVSGDLRTSYVAPLRTSYVAAAPLRSSYYLA